MKAVRCSHCGLLVRVDGEIGQLKIAEPLNHDPITGEDGFAMPESDNPKCPGSHLLGTVTDA